MPEHDRPTDHDYDGIQEYDNDLPNWWLALLWATVAFAVVYIACYTTGDGVGPKGWTSAMVELDERRLRIASASGPVSEELLRPLSHNPERVAKGRALYAQAQCATCHTAEGTGNIGPNLRDDWWTHGNTMSDLVATITDGRNNNAMPPQRANLSPDEIISLACFLAEQNRTAKAPGKAPDPTRDHQQPITY